MLELLARVSAELAAREIPHALIGAGALAVHGVSRSRRNGWRRHPNLADQLLLPMALAGQACPRGPHAPSDRNVRIPKSACTIHDRSARASATSSACQKPIPYVPITTASQMKT